MAVSNKMEVGKKMPLFIQNFNFNAAFETVEIFFS